jgi:hypothetical protein
MDNMSTFFKESRVLANLSSIIATQVVAKTARELRTVSLLHAKVDFSLLRSLPASLAAIPERSSSSLPPSFAPGHRAATFIARGTVHRGTPFVCAV